MVAAARSSVRPRRAAPPVALALAVAATAPPVVVVAQRCTPQPRGRRYKIFSSPRGRLDPGILEPRSLRVAAARVSHRADVRVRPAEGDVVVRAPRAAAGGALPDPAHALRVPDWSRLVDSPLQHRRGRRGPANHGRTHEVQVEAVRGLDAARAVSGWRRVRLRARREPASRLGGAGL